MKFRRDVMRTVAAGLAAFVVALLLVDLVFGLLIRSDVRDEMTSTLASLRTELDYNFETVLDYMAILMARCMEDPSRITQEKLDALCEDFDLDLIRIYRKPDQTLVKSGGDKGLLRKRRDLDDGLHGLELGLNATRFSQGPLSGLLLNDFCRKWPSTCDGFPLCLHESTGLVISSGSRGAKPGDTIEKVFAAPEVLKSVPEGTFFSTTVYGQNCTCALEHCFDYTFVVVVPFNALTQYRRIPLVYTGVVLFFLVAAFTLVTLRSSELLRRLRYYIDGEKTRMKEDLAAANLVQTSALPPPFPGLASFSVRARMDPAKVVGGDFYDYQVLPDGSFYFLVADVSGKGISAAMFMMRAKSVIKQCLAETHDLSKGLSRANDLLSANNESMLFVTVWIGVLEPRTGLVYYVNAGHNPPLVRRANGEKDLEWVNCPPSLVMAMMPGVEYPVHEIALQPGDSLVLYTDGVTEAQNEFGRLYGETRLEKVVRDSEGSLIDAIRADLDDFQGKAEPADDVTIVTIDFKGTPPGAARGFPCTREVGFAESVQFVESELERLACPKEFRNQFLIAYDEIGSNVVSYSGAQYFTVKLAFEATPPAFTLTVTDAGKPFNPLDKAAPDMQLSVEQRASGGFGIFITRQLMDDVIYSRDEDRNVLTLRKKL